MTLQEFFARPGSWCHRRNVDGEACCLRVAAYKCYTYTERPAVFRKLAEASGAHNLVLWNDVPGRTIADVRALVAKAGV